MKNKLFIIILSLLLFPIIGMASIITIRDADLQNGTYNWVSSNTYLLDGLVYLEPGGVLTIDAGTIIKGIQIPSNGDSTSALIITKRSQIIADGNPFKPIIFTAEIDDVNNPNDLPETACGLWGGLIILGDAPVGCPSGVSSGLKELPPNFVGGLNLNEFGGVNPNDNSGILRFVKISYAGAETMPSEPISGLTLAGVGDQTVLYGLDVTSSNEDGILFAGGNVNGRNLNVSYPRDDGIEIDLGYFGNLLSVNINFHPLKGHNGIEIKSKIVPLEGEILTDRITNPTIFNATIIGAGLQGRIPDGHAFVFLNNARGTIANSIFIDFPGKALLVEDIPNNNMDSYQALIDGEINILNNIFFNFGAGDTFDAEEGIIEASPEGDNPKAEFLIEHLGANNNTIENPKLIRETL